jgi:hypothetical protein
MSRNPLVLLAVFVTVAAVSAPPAARTQDYRK